MHRPQYEVAQIVDRFGQNFVEHCKPNSFIVRTLDALQKCRTSALGGHIDYCDCCGEQRISYNSCGNRHCPKCQGAKQSLWVEDWMNDAFDCKYFHNVFTVPEELNRVCLLDSNWFYKTLFESVWNVLQQFGYTKYSVESGAICVLHTWGQNLSLHPHIHCIVPSSGLTLAGKLKRITKNGKYLYPVVMVSTKSRSFLLKKIKVQLNQTNQLLKYRALLDDVWKKPCVAYCKPPFGNAGQIVKETRLERVARLTGFDSRICPVCRTGIMHTVELLPRIRAPTNVLYTIKILSC